MSNKRPRVVRSSSSGELGPLINLLSPVEKVTEKPHPCPRPHRSIFTLASFGEKENNDYGYEKRIDERRREFFENCFRCKKKIPADESAFMYGYLQAFCSPECREIQIDEDRRNGKLSPEPPVAATIKAKEMAKPPVAATIKAKEPAKPKKYTIAKFK
ncbi:hypothetical protein Acr_03g0018200 [Actinidia rufa]|uniref:FLZ-type domain-containing protein n=1 Tax=Actinidia rufa TaxID=165716 RepID=A0A7J0EFS6_9ERIC|nr:hypothetical protein Acr_03g0018200 [Actinidia rufa]